MIDALKDLHDIHMPPPVHLWWPPAPGILVLLVLFFLMLVYATWLFYTRKARSIKKAALRELATLQSALDTNQTAPHVAGQISVLLKQVALLYYPRAEVAALEGEAWILFLSKTAKNVDFSCVRESLLELPYSREIGSKQELDILFALTRRWIKQRSHKCLS